MNLKNFKISALFTIAALFLLICIFPSSIYSATKGANFNRKVVGIVVDSLSNEPLTFVNIYCNSTNKGVLTDETGLFSISVPQSSYITATSLGYNSNTKKFDNSIDTMVFRMSPTSYELSEVVVKPKKQKYSKKNNPAVALMQRIRADREKHKASKLPYFSYDRYDKIVLGLNNFNGYLPGDDGKIKGKLKSFAELVDTGIWTGKRILDVSVKEKLSTRLLTAEGCDKEVVYAQQASGIDKGLDQEFTRAFFDDAMREVDIYDNDIILLRNRFVSPLSALGADFYKYHIEDTVLIGKDKCVELSFAPRSKESMGFNGKLYIPVEDSVKYVRRAMMRLPKASTVNYVENMYLSQNFEIDSLGCSHKTLDDMVVELHVVANFGQVYMCRQSRYDDFRYAKHSELADYYDMVGSNFELENAGKQSLEFWNEERMLPLSYAQNKITSDSSPFNKNPLIYWTTKTIEFLVKGYIPTGKKSKFDIGPLDSFISYNPTEGLRLSLGGMTTANLSKHIFARGYAAYGFRDKKWKYKAELEYSFNDKKYHSREFPVNAIRATYQYDVNQLGQSYVYDSGGNIFTSLSRSNKKLSIYERRAMLEYNIEWLNNLSLHFSLNNQKCESSPYVRFINGAGIENNAYTQNFMRFQIRYAPGEKFMQTSNNRYRVNSDALCMSLTHSFGPKKLFGSEFTLNLTEFKFEKRFWFSAFGHIDIIVKAAKLWNQVQFPALLWQNASTDYSLQTETFNLLNPMEFAMDQYASLDFSYNMNGLIFNRIPFIKKLKLREVFTFKGFVGSLTKKNNPDYNDNLYRFPDPTTQLMGKTPYMEIGAGIDNILTLIRLDYIWRLSYKDNPAAPKSGLRFSLRFSF